MEYEYAREKGKIQTVRRVLERDYFYTVNILCSLGEKGGSCQSFGGYMLGKVDDPDTQGPALQDAWLNELCAVFGVSHPDELEGQECYVLRDFEQYGEFIRGLESVKTGRRFMARSFIRRYFPEADVENPLERRKANIIGDIERMKRDILRKERELETISSKFVDWENK